MTINSSWSRSIALTSVLVFIALFASACDWLGVPKEATTIDYCAEYKEQPPNRSCVKTIRLSISPTFGHVKKADSLYEIELAYPSMIPWRSLSWQEQSRSQKLRIGLYGVSGQTTRDFLPSELSYANELKRMAPIFGLDQYLWDGWGKRQLLVPIETSPRLVMDCTRNDSPNDLSGDNPYACISTSFTSWGLKVTYSHQRALIPEWQEVHRKVQSFIASLVVST